MRNRWLILCGLAMVSAGVALSAVPGTAGAFPPATARGIINDTVVPGSTALTEVRHRRTHRRTLRRYVWRYDRRYHGPRYGYRRHGFPYFYAGFYYGRPWWNYPAYPAYRVYRAPRRVYGGSAHVEWCLENYRSYNPRTDMFLGYDGDYHYCNSPYN